MLCLKEVERSNFGLFLVVIVRKLKNVDGGVGGCSESDSRRYDLEIRKFAGGIALVLEQFTVTDDSFFER